MIRAALPLAAALALGGCMTAKPATVPAACRTLSLPAPAPVRTDNPATQRWADTVVETGVRVCGNPRPPAPEGQP